MVADLPWMSYHTSTDEAVRNAASLIRAGAQAVKLEGGRKRLPVIEAILDAEIPVMGHLGLTPQSVHAMGGFKVQGREHHAALALIGDAKALAAAGCFSLVLEGVPDEVARLITESIDVPTVGIGAGPACDGQVLVFHDVLGIEDRLAPKFVRRYADLRSAAVEAIAAFAADVRSGRFPADDESYHLSTEVAETLGLYGSWHELSAFPGHAQAAAFAPPPGGSVAGPSRRPEQAQRSARMSGHGPAAPLAGRGAGLARRRARSGVRPRRS